ncbi:tryptophan-rich sensory protein [Nocardioides sp. CGMCC 1.13656]|uniref:TspO/MBR family protein n=1 Tax=Nocardioides TaxID=1839 RepID=UPI0015EBE73E|nr:TspO/MBR family protein [Nocardioides sp. CGMCC 1.13656]MBA2952263.1 tryptophan-rich sensory protein [Nocardioides sp. CGMCC 1.13656]
MNTRRLAFAVLPVVAAAGLGGLGSRNAPSTYARLDKPGWAPPAAAFGPVWTALYAAIAVAGWRVHAASPRARRLHLAQLALNAAWPGVFFGAREKRASVAVIATLDAVLAAEIATLRREDPVAAALLTPYLAWTGFATALNASVSEPADSPAQR